MTGEPLYKHGFVTSRKSYEDRFGSASQAKVELKEVKLKIILSQRQFCIINRNIVTDRHVDVHQKYTSGHT